MAYERRDYAGGAAETTITAGINASDTTITIASASGWPSGTNGPFAVVIDDGTANEEKVLIQSRTGTTLTVASSGRGYDGTSAASHSLGATIKHCLTAKDFDEANYWVAELAGAVNAAGDLIVGDGADSVTRLAKGANSTVLAVDSGGTLGWVTVTSAMITDGTIATGDLANSAVTEAKIAASVAGDGLTGGGGSALAVNVDNSTLAIVTDTVKVKDAGITATQIAASVAGNGLTGGAGSALAVNVDNSTLEIATDTVRVKDAGITLAKLAAAVQALLVPTGAIVAYGASTAPTGWLLCDGSAVSRTTYSALFAVIGTAFGSGDGSTTFNVPDLRGRVPVGKDDLGGSAANRITSGNSGITGTTLGAAGGDERLHGHTHTQPTHTHTQTGGTITAGIGLSAGADFASGNFSTGASGGDTTGSTGGGSSQNVQPSLITAYIIKT